MFTTKPKRLVEKAVSKTASTQKNQTLAQAEVIAKKGHKIVHIDIETSPNIGYVWGKYEQDVLGYIRESHLMTFAYKYAHEDEVHAYALPDFPLYKKDPNDDTALTIKLWEIFNDADIIVAHNGNSFDIKKANAFFAKAGLPPPSPYKTVDTKLEARKAFRLNSNKLTDIGEYFGLGEKMPTGGFSLWTSCLAGDKEAWAKMVAYNKQDVLLLEQVYLKLLPWMKNHPDIGENEECGSCGSNNLQRRGYAISRKGKCQRFQCMDCGAWRQGPKIRTAILIK